MHNSLAVGSEKRVWPCVLTAVILIASAVVLGSPLYSDAFGSGELTPPPTAIPEDYFGMHIHRALTTTPWPTVPFGSLRLWDSGVSWNYIEPDRGKWNFAKLDAWVELAEKHKVNVLLTLGMTPGWASARPNEPSASEEGKGHAAEPKDVNDWREYVRQVATRYKGRIQAYEIWNEPNLKQYFTGSVPQMVDLTCQAYSIIRKVDPDAKVVSPSAQMQSWTGQFLDAGGGDCVDIIGFHFYVGGKSPEAMVDRITVLRQILQSRGISKAIWNTESGWPKPKTFTESEAAAYVARAYIVNWAAGVARFYWYAWDNHAWVALEMVKKDDKTPTLAAQAYSDIESWLIDSTMESCQSGIDGTWICRLSKNGKSHHIAWNEFTTKSLVVPSDWHVKTARTLLDTTEQPVGKSVQINEVPQLLQ